MHVNTYYIISSSKSTFILRTWLNAYQTAMINNHRIHIYLYIRVQKRHIEVLYLLILHFMLREIIVIKGILLP